MRYAQRWVLGPFNGRELEIIRLRVSGLKAPEIADLKGWKRTTTYRALTTVMSKLGFTDIAQLTRWAIENALDEALPPEDPADVPAPEPKRDRPPARGDQNLGGCGGND